MGIELRDTSPRQVVRIGDTVRRRTYPWSPAVHALLDHLEEVGFAFSPRVLGTDDEGREILTYLPGDAGPKGWSRVVDERGLRAAARLLRDYHRAVEGWRPDPNLLWPNGKQGGGDPDDLICHGDFGPWNIVWDGLRPVGLIDWDYAYPGPAAGDLAYALEYVVPFRSDEECVGSMGYPRGQPPDRRGRLEAFVEAYGLDESAIEPLVARLIDGQRATLDGLRTLAAQGVEPQASWVAQGHLETLEQRLRWIEEHRTLFE